MDSEGLQIFASGFYDHLSHFIWCTAELFNVHTDVICLYLGRSFPLMVSLSTLAGFCRTVEVPSSRIVIIEGIYALSEKLRPLLDLRVSITGGVHFDLVKRVLRDIQRAGQEPEEIIHQISETVVLIVFR